MWSTVALIASLTSQIILFRVPSFGYDLEDIILFNSNVLTYYLLQFDFNLSSKRNQTITEIQTFKTKNG